MTKKNVQLTMAVKNGAGLAPIEKPTESKEENTFQRPKIVEKI
jgi:hypothetical protein